MKFEHLLYRWRYSFCTAWLVLQVTRSTGRSGRKTARWMRPLKVEVLTDGREVLIARLSVRLTPCRCHYSIRAATIYGSTVNHSTGSGRHHCSHYTRTRYLLSVCARLPVTMTTGVAMATAQQPAGARAGLRTGCLRTLIRSNLMTKWQSQPGGVMIKTLDSRSKDRRFNSQSGRYQTVTIPT